ncbi:radical SAM protein [Wukongibacter baidiensis]|uniref:radical SAM protein n=1 Tax=Wukongibacter baidiensis TaxID=1723361 RepID=UPI003D7FDC0D
MRYEGTVYRPPSEAYSLIIQATIGCSHNKCTFCKMYKDKQFRIRSIEEIFEDLDVARKRYRHIKRIFLADGNALALRTDDLKKILSRIKEKFPECERVGTYSATKDILRKSKGELKELNDLGLKIAYLGIESGSNEVLKDIRKGVLAKEVIEAGKKIVDAGIKLSVTVISGIGGRARSDEHARETAKIINEIKPQYIGLLALRIKPDTELYEQYSRGEFQQLSPKEIALETINFVKNLEVNNCIFRNNHAANYFTLAGTLPYDQEKMLMELNELLEKDLDYNEEYELIRRNL